MFPEEFIRRLKSQEYIDSEWLLHSLDEPAKASIRINPAKWNNEPVDASPVPWCKTGFTFKERPSFTADPLFHAGCYYPQEASGMFLEVIFNQLFEERENIRILDLCAAPGSKSTHLATLVGKNGCLIANDVIKPRASILAENMTRWGIPNTIVTCNDPSETGRLRGYFDLILVDAPCSGEGMFRNIKAREEWSEENAVLCCKRQRRILLDIWPALKENGILVYSTCTFNPAENEENVKWLTEKAICENIKIDISSFPEITEINYKGTTGYGFYPGKTNGDGFFVAVVRKNEPTEELTFKHPDRHNSISTSDLKVAREMTCDYPGEIYKYGDTVFHTPLPSCEIQTLGKMLRIIKPGTALFKPLKNDFIPLHDSAVSLLTNKNFFPAVELDYHQSVSYLKKENINIPGSTIGWNIVKYRGVNFGFVKSTGNRINNYFPIKQRIMMNERFLDEKKIINWDT